MPISAAVSVLIGTIWLFAWISGAAQRWAAGPMIVMKTNMALGSLIAGAALLLLWTCSESIRRRATGTVAAILVFAIGVITLTEHLFGYNIGIDQLLFAEPSGAVATVSPNRMGPPGALSLTLIGLGLLFLSRRRAAAPFLGLIVCLVNLVPAVGYIYGVNAFYGTANVTGIAWSTIIALTTLGLGLMLSNADAGPTAMLLRQDAGGELLRRLLPATVAMALTLGYLRRQAENAGLFDSATGTALLVLALIILFSILFWKSAARLSASAAAEAASVKALRQSEERFRLIFDRAGVGVVEVNAADRFVAANERACEILGYHCEELLGMSVNELTAPEDRLRSDELNAQLHEGRFDRFENEKRYLKRDGTPVWVNVTVSAVRDEAGHFLGAITTIEDISKRKKAEDAARYLSAIVESSGEAIIGKTLEGKITSWNGGAELLYGYTAAEVIGLPISILFPPDHSEELPDLLRKLAAGEPIERYESVRKRKDGSLIPVWVNISPIHDGDGNIVGASSIAHDITDRKHAEEALRESEQRVRTKLESLISPEGDLGALELADIVDVPKLQELFENFNAITHMPVAVLDTRGQVLIGAGWQEICTDFHRPNPASCLHCIESDSELSANVPAGEYKLYQCKNHLWDVATPIMVGGKHVGNVFTGQFFFEDETPDVELFREQARRFGFPETEYLAALDRVPRFSRDMVQAGIKYLMKLADVISNSATAT